MSFHILKGSHSGLDKAFHVQWEITQLVMACCEEICIWLRTVILGLQISSARAISVIQMSANLSFVRWSFSPSYVVTFLKTAALGRLGTGACRGLLPFPFWKKPVIAVPLNSWKRFRLWCFLYIVKAKKDT